MYYEKKPEYVPTLDEAIRMANASGSLRNRAIILTLLSTGLRTSTLRAILYGEVREELERGLGRIHIKIHRGTKKVVPNACKGGIEYDVFTCPEATEALRLYIKQRIRRFGKIDDDEPLFISEPSKLRRLWKKARKPLTSREVQLVVKEAAKRAGIERWKDVTPKSLRKTYESILRSPLADGGRMDWKTQEILMGHKLPGAMHAYYRASVEDLRKECAKLIFTPRGEGETEDVLRVVAEVLGIDFLKLMESSKNMLGRDLSIEEKMQLLKQSVKDIVSKIKNAERIERKATSPERSTENPQLASLTPSNRLSINQTSAGQTLLVEKSTQNNFTQEKSKAKNLRCKNQKGNKFMLEKQEQSKPTKLTFYMSPKNQKPTIKKIDKQSLPTGNKKSKSQSKFDLLHFI